MPIYTSLAHRTPNRSFPSPLTNLTSVLLIAAAAAMSLTSAALAQPTITNIGVLPGGTASFFPVINANGTAVGGTSSGVGNVSAIRWTAGGGAQNLGSLFGGNTQSQAINADGTVIAGYSALPGSARAFRWTAADGMQNLGGLAGAGGAYSAAQGISADGAHIVGVADTAGGDTHAVRWHAGSIEDLGTLTGGTFSSATGISADASTIVGNSNDADGNFVAVRWTSGGGIASLGVLSGFEGSDAFATSANGSVIVGFSYLNDFTSFTASRWTAAGGQQSLGALGTDVQSIASSVTADGSIITGSSFDSTNVSRAVLWSSALGIVDLNLYLPTLGVDLTGWSLQDASISADGTALTGNGTFNGEGRIWLVTSIPTPGAASVLALGGLVASRRRR